MGSLHCVGMCGGLSIVASGGSARSQMLGQSCYHLGRGISYVTLGAAAGYFGGEVLSLLRLLTSEVPWWLIVAVVLLGALCIVQLVGRSRRAELVQVRVGKRIWGRFSSAPLALGLLTALLPCPWLYSFVAVAAISAEPSQGAILMSAFWMGTVPALLLTGTLFERMARRFLVGSRALTVMLLIIALGFSLAAHLMGVTCQQH